MTTFSEFRRKRIEERVDDAQAHDGLSDDKLDALIIPASARDLQGTRAGFTTRMIAAFIDVLTIALVVVAVWGVNRLIFLVLDPTNVIDPPSLTVIALGGFPLMWIYWTAAWATSGRTIGSTILGLKVVTTKGGTLPWPVAAMRGALCILVPIGALWILVGRSNASVQDVMLRTQVVYHWQRGTAGRDR